jgi:hypothetical protein
MKKQSSQFWRLAAVLCWCAWLPWATAHASDPPRELAGVTTLMEDFAEEIGHARDWLNRYNDVTSVVEILNSMQEIESAKTDRAFEQALKTTFPGSRRVARLEPLAMRKLARFFDYYSLRGKIRVMVFSLSYPMAFDTGPVVGVSDKLVETWSDEEMSGVVAHEIGHIIAQTQERLSGQTPPDSRAYYRSEEIKADWVALMMFRAAGLEPRRVASGLERIVPRSHYKRPGPQHPPMAVRSALMREWMARMRPRPRLHEALLQASSPNPVMTQP